MFDAAKKHDARRAEVYARLLAATAALEASIATSVKYVSTTADTTAATVRPSR